MNPLALLERVARQREDEDEMAVVASRLARAEAPTTRRAAAQLQTDLDRWERWRRAGTVLPEIPRRVKRSVSVKSSDRRSPKIKRGKLTGPTLERDREWQERGTPKRSVAVVAFDFVPVTGEVYEMEEGVYGMVEPDEEYEE